MCMFVNHLFLFSSQRPITPQNLSPSAVPRAVLHKATCCPHPYCISSASKQQANLDDTLICAFGPHLPALCAHPARFFDSHGLGTCLGVRRAAWRLLESKFRPRVRPLRMPMMSSSGPDRSKLTSSPLKYRPDERLLCAPDVQLSLAPEPCSRTSSRGSRRCRRTAVRTPRRPVRRGRMSSSRCRECRRCRRRRRPH